MCFVSKNIFRARRRRSGQSTGGIPTRSRGNVLYCVRLIVVFVVFVASVVFVAFVVFVVVIIILCFLMLRSKNLYQTRRRRSGQSAGGIPTRGRGNVLYCVRLIVVVVVVVVVVVDSLVQKSLSNKKEKKWSKCRGDPHQGPG